MMAGARAAHPYPYFAIMVSMTDKDVMQRVADLCRTSLLPTVRKTLKGKSVWRIRVGRKDGVIDLVKSLYPLMGERRQKAIQKMLILSKTYPSRYGYG
jgi:hypothetical protein